MRFQTEAHVFAIDLAAVVRIDDCAQRCSDKRGMRANDADIPAHDLDRLHFAFQRAVFIRNEALRTNGGIDLSIPNAGRGHDGFAA